MNTTVIEMTITEDTHDTMRIAGLGPQFSALYTEVEKLSDSADETVSDDALGMMDALDALQERGEAEHFAAWKANLLAEAERLGYDTYYIRVLDTAEHWRGTRHPINANDPDGYTIEGDLWQAAHDSTPSPEAWAAEWIPSSD